MRTSERWLIIALLVLLFGVWGTRAQNPLVTPYYTLVPTAATYSTTSCPTPPSGYFAYCHTGTGLYTITSAGVVTPPGTATAGVTSVNGSTGAVTISLSGGAVPSLSVQ
jgi:hypothetical protein